MYRKYLPLALLAVLLLAGLSAAYVFRPVTPAVTRFFVFPPDKATFVMIASATAASGAISPDGRTLAFTARDDAGKILLWVRPIDALAAQPLVGTDNAASPFWSPDSRFIAYFASGKVLKISASGGPPQTVSEPAGNRGGAWSRDPHPNGRGARGVFSRDGARNRRLGRRRATRAPTRSPPVRLTHHRASD